MPPEHSPLRARRSLMRRVLRHFHGRCEPQQAISVLLLVTLFAALVPVPVMTPHHGNGKDLSRPFPCQDRPCGCRSAEQCKKKCCCFSDKQKLAWAKLHRVEASEVLTGSAKSETVAVTARNGCCSSGGKAKSPSRASRNASKSTTKAKTRSQVVIAAIAQECQGVALTLSGQSVFIIPPTISLQSFTDSAGDSFALNESRFDQINLEPPVPPPRLIVD